MDIKIEAQRGENALALKNVLQVVITLHRDEMSALTLRPNEIDGLFALGLDGGPGVKSAQTAAAMRGLARVFTSMAHQIETAEPRIEPARRTVRIRRSTTAQDD